MRKISIIVLALIVIAGIGIGYAQECCSKVEKVESKVSSAAVSVEGNVKKAEAPCKCEAAKTEAAQDAKSCCGHAQKVESEVKASAQTHAHGEGHAEKVQGQKASCCSHGEGHESGEKAHKECNCKDHKAEAKKEKK